MQRTEIISKRWARKKHKKQKHALENFSKFEKLLRRDLVDKAREGEPRGPHCALEATSLCLLFCFRLLGFKSELTIYPVTNEAGAKFPHHNVQSREEQGNCDFAIERILIWI